MQEHYKPHKGRITTWRKLEHDTELTAEYYPDSEGDLGYTIAGRYEDHYRFAGQYGRTSWVVKHDLATGEIETRNSRYTLVGKECTED